MCHILGHKDEKDSPCAKELKVGGETYFNDTTSWQSEACSARETQEWRLTQMREVRGRPSNRLTPKSGSHSHPVGKGRGRREGAS